MLRIINVPKSAVQKAVCGCSGIIELSQDCVSNVAMSKPAKKNTFFMSLRCFALTIDL